MERTLKYEELAMFGLAVFLFSETSYIWWLFPALILLPDIGMIGYLVNTKIGAITYNLFHHKGIAIMTFITGYYFAMDWMVLTGIILFGHASLDRIFGYGLKYEDHFKHTHLGWLQGAQDDTNSTIAS